MRLRGTKTSTVSSSQGLGDQLYDLGGARPTLDLNFANNDSLADSITGKTLPTFTRASSATYVDGDGVIKTSPVNLMTRSEEIDQGFQFFGASVTPNAITAPDGTFTADLIDVTAAANSQVVLSFTVEPSTTYTVSFWAKSTTATDSLRLYRTASNGGLVNINITNEWQRYTSTYTTDASSPYGNVLFIYSPGSTNQYYVWGVQVEEGSTATDYIPTTSTISGAPRFDHDPATGESLGLLIEEASTNLIHYSEPDSGTPSNSTDGEWSFDNLDKNTEISKVEGPDGVSNSASRMQLATGSSWDLYARIENLTPGEKCTFSGWVKLGTATNFAVHINNTTSWDSIADGVYSFDASDGLNTTSFVKISHTFTVPSNRVNVHIGRHQGTAPAQQTAGTVDVWGLQFERKSFATSTIITSGADVTRAADVAEITGNKFAKTNLLTYSERFDEWTLGANTPVTPNTIAAPDGSTTADQIYLGGPGTGGGSFLHQSVTLTQNQTYTYSVYAKAVTPGSNNQFHLYSNSVNPKYPSSAFVATSEWKRFNFTFTHTDPTASVEMYILNLNDTYTTDVYFWGAQLETGDVLTEYTPSVETFVSRSSSATYVDDTTGLIKTTPVNLLIRSEELDNATWVKSSVTFTADIISAPDGSVTVDKPSVTWNFLAVYDNSNSSFLSGYPQAFPFTVTDQWVRHSVQFTTPAGCTSIRYYPGRVGFGGTSYIYQNLSVTAETTYTASAHYKLDTDGTVLIWGAQVEVGSTASPYIKTEATSSGAARYENGELILEEARTNIIDRNTINWNSIWQNSIPTGAYNNAGIAPDGTNTAFATTAYGGFRGQKNYAMTADTNDYTFSIFIKSTGGQGVYKTYATGFNVGNQDTFGVTAYNFATDTVGDGYSRKLYANGWVRIWKTYANTNKTLFIVSNGTGTSLDMLFWGAQLEQGSYPSSLIITPDGANVTRAADVSTSALGVDSFYSQSEGTVFVEALNYGHPTTGTALVPLSFSDNSFTNLIQLGGSTGSNVFNFDTISSGTQSRTTLGNYSSDKLKSAGAYKVADQAGSLDGASVVTSSPSSIASTINRLDIGNNHTGGLSINGHIKRLTYFPTRLPNANLQNITS